MLRDVWRAAVGTAERSAAAGKHMRRKTNVVPRCGEHSNTRMYVEHGAALALESRAVVVVSEMAEPGLGVLHRNCWISLRFMIPTHMKKGNLAKTRTRRRCRGSACPPSWKISAMCSHQSLCLPPSCTATSVKKSQTLQDLNPGTVWTPCGGVDEQRACVTCTWEIISITR